MSNYSILIDGIEIDNQRIVDITQLVSSITVDEKDEYYFYTCSRGVPECGGIWEPIIVYKENGYIYWDMLYPYGGRFKFNEKQYTKEIIQYKDETMTWDWMEDETD